MVSSRDRTSSEPAQQEGRVGSKGDLAGSCDPERPKDGDPSLLLQPSTRNESVLSHRAACAIALVHLALTFPFEDPTKAFPGQVGPPLRGRGLVREPYVGPWQERGPHRGARVGVEHQAIGAEELDGDLPFQGQLRVSAWQVKLLIQVRGSCVRSTAFIGVPAT